MGKNTVKIPTTSATRFPAVSPGTIVEGVLIAISVVAACNAGKALSKFYDRVVPSIGEKITIGKMTAEAMRGTDDDKDDEEEE